MRSTEKGSKRNRPRDGISVEGSSSICRYHWPMPQVAQTQPGQHAHGVSPASERHPLLRDLAVVPSVYEVTGTLHLVFG